MAAPWRWKGQSLILIYLAGPIRGLTYQGCTEWREYAKSILEDLGHQTASPMRGKEYLKNLGPLSLKGDGGYEEFPLSSSQGLFRRDIFDVAMCDAVLANFEGANDLSLGTAMEVQRAYDLDKYVMTVLEAGSKHDHAFIRQASSCIVPTLDDALHYLAVIGAPYV